MPRQFSVEPSLSGHPRFNRAGFMVINTREIRRACGEWLRERGQDVSYAEIIAAEAKAKIEERKQNEQP